MKKYSNEIKPITLTLTQYNLMLLCPLPNARGSWYGHDKPSKLIRHGQFVVLS
jgi:hypothetical protein